ncbi:tRNA1(Val) (adenine(37)-N6)-methyltransferase [Paenibacillus sp. JCM 10914]|uniref:tRNA1(Val) (adenine(37)-N6)-methyltransferase n=1 Tax=Paenibacillus sp. JCM 10914 TaxID=1236974 RepID=UPI0003CC394B|nr:tRNA1(Val) (adenine(37)-N6)-methyltransferase [Paenibacillus sp. JCM 10914]GAE09926.1 predicted O-methyltransferase [Paenibacillus sp. JCM 10914]
MKWNEVSLAPSERIDDLLTHELGIIQSEEVFSFSMDAVLLARFASIPRRGRILDMCTGNGVIPILMSTRTKAPIEGIEIQPRLADMARRSVKMNDLQDQITIHEGDLRELYKEEGVGYGAYDLITVNPPYMPMNGSDLKLNEHQAIARHEVYCTLEEVIASCARLLRQGGKMSMVHKPLRLAEIITLMSQYRIEPKVIRFVHPRANMEANMVLIEGIRDGKPEVRLKAPLIVYDDQGQYGEEFMEIYYGSQ